MSGPENPNRVLWIGDAPAPLCHVPWTGTVVVLADGGVNFCCYSEAVVGNVNSQTFEEVWNGPVMVSIRQDLAAQRFPPQCQSMSCPFYRGDKLTYLATEIEPHNFDASGTHDPHADIRSRLRGTTVHVIGEGNTRGIALDVSYKGELIWADLFVGVQDSNGLIRFLPSLEEFTLPFQCALELSENRQSFRIEIPLGEECSSISQFSIALFEADSDPNRLSNCFWSTTLELAAEEASAKSI